MKLNTVFVYFNVVNGMVTGAEHQLDCAYVRSFLEKKGIKTAQYIAHRTTRISQFMMQIKDYSAELYVFFINEYNYYISSIVIHHLKENDKNVKIAVLGPVVKHLSQSSLRTKTIDYYIIGNPYEAIMQIVQGIQKDKIVNICYWLEDKFIINEQKRIEIFMDELGGIYSSGIVPYEEAGNIGLLTSRGCFGRCTFCSYVKNSFEKAHSIDFLLNELDYISTMTNNSPIGLSFFDDCFSLNTGRSIKICEEVSKRQYNMRFWCCTRADVLNTELIDKMALCNFRNIVIGMETASVDLLQNSGKVVNGESSAQGDAGGRFG